MINQFVADLQPARSFTLVALASPKVTLCTHAGAKGPLLRQLLPLAAKLLALESEKLSPPPSQLQKNNQIR
jgi:hypothetical protein